MAVGGLEEHDAGESKQCGVDREDGQHDRRVHQAALHNHFDVHQPVTDQGRREGQRHQAQRKNTQLHRQRGAQPERIWQRVSQRKRPGAKRGAPDNPAQLPSRSRGPHPVHRAREHHETGNHVGRQIGGLELIERREHARIQWRVQL